MKVLLAYVKYAPEKPVLSNLHSNLTGSFLSAFENDPDYQLEHLFFSNEPGDIQTAKQLNEELLKREFDIAIVSENQKIVLDINTVKKLGKKLFVCNWDCNSMVSTDSWVNFRLFIKKPANLDFIQAKHSLLEMSQYCNILNFDYGYGEMLPNIYGVATPQDSRIFHTVPEDQREYDVLFCGSLHMQERHSILRKLIDNGINVKVVGGKWPPENTLHSFEEYAEQFRKSKISISFNESMFFKKQRKGRIYESISCGALCAMTYPEVVKFRNHSWFEESKHFVSINFNNCVDVIKYYLDNPTERIEIAKAGYEHYQETVAPKVFWNEIFSFVNDK